MSLDKLHKKTLHWQVDRGFFNPVHGTTTEKQYIKLVEELGEMARNISRGIPIMDDIGDCLVVLTAIAELEQTSLLECWEYAFNEIKDRRGQMVNGVFVKEKDLKK